MAKADPWALRRDEGWWMAQWQDGPGYFYDEAAEAAAKVLDFYWGGMDDGGVRADQLEYDVDELAKTLRHWLARCMAARCDEMAELTAGLEWKERDDGAVSGDDDGDAHA